MNSGVRLPNCKKIFISVNCQEFCRDVLRQFNFLFGEMNGVVIGYDEYPQYDCELIVKIYNGILFRFWWDRGGWTWFIKLPFKNRDGASRWETWRTLLDYIEKRTPILENGITSSKEIHGAIGRIANFYDSADFNQFEEQYECWSEWYSKELDKEITKNIQSRYKLNGPNEEDPT